LYLETFVKKTQNKINPKTIAVAASLAAMQMGASYAQTLNLDEVVVTASPTGRTKMKSSDSVTSMGEEAIARTGATNVADILRAVPGIRAEASGGDGNANVVARGIPMSAGGGRYVQFQEDGLPVLMFGDIEFATPDMFMRTDYMTDRVEVVRGGSASTLTSNAPGAIMNFITKNSRDAGNSVGYTTGIGNRLNRVDFAFTNALSEDTHINFGGFQRQSDGGPGSANYTAADGGQIRGAITKTLDQGGYVRATFKSLDDRSPSLMPVPVTIGANGQITKMAGFDPRKTSVAMVGGGFTRDTTMDKNGNLVTSNPQDGTKSTSHAFGLEGKFNLSDGWSIEERFRKSSNSGQFNGPLGLNLGATDIRNVQLSTSNDNVDATFNDIKALKSFELNGGKSVFTGGLFTGTQRLAQTWGFNQYMVNAADIGNYTTQKLNANGSTLYDNPRTYDVTYTQTAPYAVLNWDKDQLNLDASVRNNSFTASGATYRPYTDSAGNYNTTGWNPASKDTVNYRMNKNAYSLGANYTINRDLSVYSRISDGHAMPNERNMYGAPGALNGHAPGLNQVKQQEAGVKYRDGNFNMFATYFQAQTDESNYEVTTNTSTVNSYESKGVELEVGYKSGGFRLGGGVTLTDAKIVKSNTQANVGHRPKNQAPVMYQFTPSYSFGQTEVGVAVIGTTDSYYGEDNAVKMPGYTLTNLFVNYKIDKKATANFSVANLFDKDAYTEGNVGAGFIRSIPGRTARASIRYEF
jgi:outer membrane receptor protein involved in Fe transport